MPSMSGKQLGRQALKYADNDCWEECLSVLRSDSRYGKEIPIDEANQGVNTNENETIQIWLHGSTIYGDYLVHLCAFAACETSLSLQKRKIALYCLKLILEWEGMKASQRVARDGGTALHCALASASSSLYHADNDCVEDEDQSDIVDEDEDIESDHDEDFDEKFLLSQYKRDEEIQFISDSTLSDDKLILSTITMLLDAGADPNTKLVNILQCDSDGEEDDEIELNYAREAILQQWNPLIMVTTWIASSYQRQPVSLDAKESKESLPLKILSVLVAAGADPTYEVGQFCSDPNEESKSWLPIEFAAICLAGCNNQSILNKNNSERFHSIWDHVHRLLIKAGSPHLTHSQSFIIHILNNNVVMAKNTASQIRQSNENDFDRYGEFYAWQIQDFFPLPEIVFAFATSENTKTLLEMACYVRALESVKYLLHHMLTQGRTGISDSLCRNVILSLFEHSNLNSNASTLIVEKEIEFRKSICIEVIHTYCKSQLNIRDADTKLESVQSSNEYNLLHQQFLDKLLLYTCATRRSSTDQSLNDSHELLSCLLDLGSDPNVQSVINTQVHGKQTPLHILAGNRHDLDGIDFMRILLSSGSNPDTLNEDRLLPIQIALKFKNYKAVQLLWKHHDANTMSSTLKLGLTMEETFTLGLASIDNHDVDMLEFTTNSLRARGEQYLNADDIDETNNQNVAKISRYLGNLLLRSVDPRSGFASVGDESCYVSIMSRVVLDIFLSFEKGSNLEYNELDGIIDDPFSTVQILPSFIQSEVSQKSVFHFILSHERFKGQKLREILLMPLCMWVLSIERREHDVRRNEKAEGITRSKLLSMQCHHNFGGYTALHLAYAIGCETSIRTLLKFGADTCVSDEEGNFPHQLINND